jgi:putative ABC transport system permease protein
MPLTSRVPLAWRNLTDDPRRFAVWVGGVAFAVFLMFTELGFWNALLDASTALLTRLNGELVVVSRATYAMNVRERFTPRRLEQARAVPGVRAAYPVYVTRCALWSYPAPQGGPAPEPTSRLVRVVAFDPDDPALDLAGLDALRPLLRLPDRVLLDERSRPDPAEAGGVAARKMMGRTVEAAGTFALGTDFTSDGTVLMSDRTFARLFRPPGASGPGPADLGVVRLAPGASAEAVRDELGRALPDDVAVYTREEFVRQERDFWQEATPVGFVFTFGLLLGFAVGAVICHQVISTDVTDRLGEFATLKAVGYSDAALGRAVLRQALLLSVLGFVPGLVLSVGLYALVERQAGLPMRLTAGRVLLVFALTAAMSALSGLLSLRKVRAADPAEVFA